MAMQTKIFDHINYFFEERDDAVAGKLRRVHDWCKVSKGTVSGWMPRPQRFVDGDKVNRDNMADTTWDNMDEWSGQFVVDNENPSMVIHGLCEMPVAYSRTKKG